MGRGVASGAYPMRYSGHHSYTPHRGSAVIDNRMWEIANYFEGSAAFDDDCLPEVRVTHIARRDRARAGGIRGGNSDDEASSIVLVRCPFTRGFSLGERDPVTRIQMQCIRRLFGCISFLVRGHRDSPSALGGNEGGGAETLPSGARGVANACRSWPAGAGGGDCRWPPAIVRS